MDNLAQLLVRQEQRGSDQPFGMIGQPATFGEFYSRAERLAATLLDSKAVIPGRRVALVGSNCPAYLDAWMALQLCGAEAALINPTYPPNLLKAMIADIDPMSVVWVNMPAVADIWPGGPHVEIGAEVEQEVIISGTSGAVLTAGREMPGLGRKLIDTAGFMHTSGTSGRPKFCAQSHDYFLRMAKYLGDRMALSRFDTVFTPLPLFHINPLGYGVITALFGGAGVLSASRFSASRFWREVVDQSVSVLILHAPPIEILLRTTSPADSAGHRIRYCLYTSGEFLSTFDIPMGQSGYGSTEVGGVSHSWIWRDGDIVEPPEGMAHFGGIARPDIEWRLSADNEIEIRGLPRTALFSGYQTGAERRSPFDADGWFATGDLGRVDDSGALVFIERKTESLRVSGEYVPIPFVERHFAKVNGVSDVAIWRELERDGDSDRLALFVVGPAIEIESLRLAATELPKFMRPHRFVELDEIPRDPGVGKVQRRQLADRPIRHTWPSG